ncbi:MAG: LmeA family phospholipid-binding protein [Anaerolineales bacterium]|nr:LmeA family phospholipid-binding protein [Anaerolineales bacterium]MDW8447151.1 LmeA family phospholipid-binding protein [Anaerolineales bacterium]
MSKKTRWLVVLLAITGLLTLSCRLSEAGLPRASNPPVSTEEAASLESKLEQALREANERGTFTLEVTEQQLTSYVALSLEKYTKEPITNVQFQFREGKIFFSGIVHRDGLQFPVRAVGKIGLDATGSLAVELAEAKIGPFPLPQSVRDNIAEEMKRAFKEQIAISGSELVIEEVTIREGSILIRGTKK